MPGPLFTPAEPGTDESAWQTCLSDVGAWSPSSFTPNLWVVSPHPDDECLGAGGLIASAIANGCKTWIVSVSDGEAAYPERRELAETRHAELLRALQELSYDQDAGDITNAVAPSILRLRLPDGRLAEFENAVADCLTDRIALHDVLVGPFEHDGHPDHDAVGRACITAGARRGLPVFRYPIWAWHHYTPESLRRQRLRKFLLTEPSRRAKQRALQCYQSQIGSADTIVPPHVLRYFERDFETFTV